MILISHADTTCCNPLTTLAGSKSLFCVFCSRVAQQDTETKRIFRLPWDGGLAHPNDDEEKQSLGGALEWLMDDGTGVIIKAAGCIEVSFDLHYGFLLAIF